MVAVNSEFSSWKQEELKTISHNEPTEHKLEILVHVI